ncbi:hypothetical protein [Spirulina major]|uniref:hypothetical protein n=1 Tax=Spirulina major TaxID=270636 RepID=UPI000A5707B0|nr:hypothetical protein [Spirulina major]
MIPVALTALSASPAVALGLAGGSLVRYGSVVRHAAGTAQGGQIVAHLSEAAGLTSKLATLAVAPPLGAAQLAIDGIGHVATFNKLVRIDSKITGLQQIAAQILGVSQIAAGASVLGLGVSIAGFAYMGYKLHQVQKSIGQLQQSMDAGFIRVEDRLDQLSMQLGYIHLLVVDSLEQQKRQSVAIANLHKALLISKIADLQAELDSLKRFPDDSPKAALKVAASARVFLAAQATQAQLEAEPNTLMLVDVATQGWAVATATEAQLLLKHGLIQDAQDVLRQTVPQLQQHAANWAGKLLSDERPELNTAQRFATPLFKPHITAERVDRIVRISPSDQNLSADRAYQKRTNAQVEVEMGRTKPMLTQQWQYRQIALAEYLDTLSELTARLDSLLAFADLCAAQNVKNSTQLLPPADAKPGLYLLPAY